jgi:hypothetical protein
MLILTFFGSTGKGTGNDTLKLAIRIIFPIKILKKNYLLFFSPNRRRDWREGDVENLVGKNSKLDWTDILKVVKSNKNPLNDPRRARHSTTNTYSIYSSVLYRDCDIVQRSVSNPELDSVEKNSDEWKNETRDASDIRPDNPAFMISVIQPDTRLPCRISGKAQVYIC